MPNSIFCGSKDGVLVDRRYPWPIFYRLPLLLSEGGRHSIAPAVTFIDHVTIDNRQPTTDKRQLRRPATSAADAPKPTTSPASSSRLFDCLLLCFKAILPHLLDL